MNRKLALYALAFVVLRGDIKEKNLHHVDCTVTGSSYAPVVIKGKIRGQLYDSLLLTFWDNYLYGATNGGSVEFYVKVSKRGNFTISLPPIDHPGRIRLCPPNNFSCLMLNFQLVEPGDNIYMSVNIRDNNPTIQCSGVGAAKYHVRINYYNYDNRKEPALLLSEADSIILSGLRILDKFKKGISQKAYEILRADVIGNEYGNLCRAITYSDLTTRQSWKPVMKEINKAIDTSKGHYIALSSGYIAFLYEKAKLDLILESNQRLFEEVYRKLRNRYSGELREKLLAYSIAEDYDKAVYFHGIDADSFTACLKDAYELIESPFLKQEVMRKLETIARGAIAFDFALPDTTGKMTRLHDFRGKLVFIDIYGPNCGGCLQFKNDFEKKVYPVVKCNPDLVIIYISTHKSRLGWLKDLDKYSNRDFVNLYTEGVGFNHPLINHYNLMGVPFHILVDKDGKIISATISPDGEQVLNLIVKSLLTE